MNRITTATWILSLKANLHLPATFANLSHHDYLDSTFCRACVFESVSRRRLHAAHSARCLHTRRLSPLGALGRVSRKTTRHVPQWGDFSLYAQGEQSHSRRCEIAGRH